MTFLQSTLSEQKLVRIQEKGKITLPAKVRQKLGLKRGDLVAVVETDGGVLITPQEVIAMQALDRMGTELNKKGLTLEALIESGRDIRSQMLKEKYGINPNQKTR